MAADSKLYDQFEPAERLTLMLEAMARRDDAEAERLGTTCPRKTYSQRDVAFSDRFDVVFDIVAVVCIDLRGLWGKLDILEWAIANVQHFAGMHHINASMAFMDGTRCAKGESQMDFFARRRQDLDEQKRTLTEAAEEDEGDDDDVEDDDERAELTPRLSEVLQHEMSTRLQAVEERSEYTVELIELVLRKVARDVAQDFVNAWTAFGEFCRTRVGIEPETMLAAWVMPIDADFTGVVGRYPDVQPQAERAAEYLGYICAPWDRRFSV